jgi:hypothetical protein
MILQHWLWLISRANPTSCLYFGLEQRSTGRLLKIKMEHQRRQKRDLLR